MAEEQTLDFRWVKGSVFRYTFMFKITSSPLSAPKQVMFHPRTPPWRGCWPTRAASAAWAPSRTSTCTCHRGSASKRRTWDSGSTTVRWAPKHPQQHHSTLSLGFQHIDLLYWWCSEVYYNTKTLNNLLSYEPHCVSHHPTCTVASSWVYN